MSHPDAAGPAWVEPRDIMRRLRAALVAKGFDKDGGRRYLASDEVAWVVEVRRLFTGPHVDISLWGCLRQVDGGSTELPPPGGACQVSAVWLRAGLSVPEFAGEWFEHYPDFFTQALAADSRFAEELREQSIDSIAGDLASYGHELSTVRAMALAARGGRLMGSWGNAVRDAFATYG